MKVSTVPPASIGAYTDGRHQSTDLAAGRASQRTYQSKDGRSAMSLNTTSSASYDEMVALGELFCERLNEARGPVCIAVPTQGLSIPNTPGGPFWDPEADAAFLRTLQSCIRSDIPIHTYECHVNDPAFGVEVAELFIDMMRKEP
ncbi:MAG TPA: Tm-1-like ATP-binding domain-containing protein [Aggregatilineales bacterium]|nr:Tm-1-like ATP-binding domain-containing protein [Aggregatilineales bacterium]